MDKLSIFEQLCKLLEPLLVPIFSIVGAIGAIIAFLKSHIDDVNKIKIDVAVQSQQIKEFGEKQNKMDGKIDRINEIVHEIKDQEHGVLNAALSKIEEVEERFVNTQQEFMKVLNTKFPEYDRKLAIIFNKQKRQSK